MLARKFNLASRRWCALALGPRRGPQLAAYGAAVRCTGHSAKARHPLLRVASGSRRRSSLPDKDATVPGAEAARRGRADLLELFEKRGIKIALEGDDLFLAACALANEDRAHSLAAADPSVVGRIQSRSPGLLAISRARATREAVRLMLDLSSDAGIARMKPDLGCGRNSAPRRGSAWLPARSGVTDRARRAARRQAARWVYSTRCGSPMPGAAIGMDAERIHAPYCRSTDQGGSQRGRRQDQSDCGGVPRARR